MEASDKKPVSHVSVLLNEAIDGLMIRAGDIFVDGTLGDGGHSLEVQKRFGDKVIIVGIDRDQNAIDRVQEKFAGVAGKEKEGTGKIFLRQGNFRNVEGILKSAGFEKADKFLFDIGLSSRQLEESGRGFSFKKDEPLIMTFENSIDSSVGGSSGTGAAFTAKEVVNTWQEESLADVIYGFGEEKFARRIAKGIVEARQTKEIETTGELVEIIKKSTPFYYHFGKIHPATRTFQAIRIAVNDELGSLADGLKSAWRVLSPGGRIAVISFHSLEDRIVKNYFNELKKGSDAYGDEDGNVNVNGNVSRAKIITKKPIVASDEEVERNPRARSAKLRIIEKTA